MAKSAYLTEPKRREGSFTPLFERLVDFDTEASSEPSIQKFYDTGGVKDSIERELLHLLGTRVKVRKEDYINLVKEPMNYGLPGMYGIPDFSYFEGTNSTHWKPFAKYVSKAIEAFEPRLSSISVTVTGVDKQRQFLDITITATINSSQFQEEVTFAMKIKAS